MAGVGDDASGHARFGGLRDMKHDWRRHGVSVRSTARVSVRTTPVAYHAPMPPTRGRVDDTDPPEDSLDQALALVVGLRTEVRELLEFITPGDAPGDGSGPQRGLGALLPGGVDAAENRRTPRSRAIGQLAGDEPPPGTERDR